MSFSQEIRKIRLDSFLSQEEFAKVLGVTVMTINRWENGKSLPTLKTRKRIDLFCQENRINYNIRELNNTEKNGEKNV